MREGDDTGDEDDDDEDEGQIKVGQVASGLDDVGDDGQDGAYPQ